MTANLFGRMLNLLVPPRASKDDHLLVEALQRHTSATKQVVEKASNIDKAMSNIQQAGEGLFA